MEKQVAQTKKSFEVGSYKELLEKAKELFNLSEKEKKSLRVKEEYYAVFKPKNVSLKYFGNGTCGIHAIIVACPENGNSLIFVYPDIDFQNHSLKIVFPHGITSVEETQTAASALRNGNENQFVCRLNGKDCINKESDNERFYIASENKEDLEELKLFVQEMIKLK